MDNKITDWNEYYNKKFKKINKEELENDKLYEKTIDNHHINQRNNIILSIGPSGSGKTTGVVDFIIRTKDKNNDIPFYTITYFTASTSDEGLIKLLRELIPSVIVIDEVEDLPKIETVKKDNTYNKNLKNIIIFDDIANLNKKQKDIINNWSNSGRKLFSHMFFIAQNFFDIPSTIRRNVNYIFLYKTNELSVVKVILKKYNIYNIDENQLYDWYKKSTEDKGDFLLIDLTVGSKYKIRHNYLDVFY